MVEPEDARRMIAPGVAIEPRGPRRGTREAQRRRHLARHPSRPLEAFHRRGRLPEQLDRRPAVGEGALEAFEELAHPRLVEIEGRAPRADQAAPEAAAADLRRQVEEVAADPAAVGGGRQEADVAGERAEVAGVAGQPLELQSDPPQRRPPRRRPAAGERLDDLAVRRAVADRRVARRGLEIMDGPAIRSAGERPFDPPVLVAEADLEMEDVLAMALEAEVPGLDDAGMHRADPHLVDLRALDAIEVDDAGNPGRGGARTPEGRLEADRLEPRMSFRTEPVLLGDLPLEQVDLRALRRERGEGLTGEERRADGQL